MHPAAKYLGKPWEAGARGPDAFDCWGLKWRVYLEFLGIRLPDFIGIVPRSLAALREFENATKSQDWERLKKPVDYCAVAMGQTYITHVGVYMAVDEGLVLHCAEGHNVVADSPGFLKAAYRWGRLEYYRHGAHR